MINFYDCFDLKEGRLGVIVTFLAILEMVKENLLIFPKTKNFQ